MNISRSSIDHLLHKIKISCIIHESEKAERTVYNAVVWYIETGRASLDWIRALDDKKTYKGMITKVLKGDCSDSGVIKTITKELKINDINA